MNMHTFLILARVDITTVIQFLVIFAFFFIPILKQIWLSVTAAGNKAQQPTDATTNPDKQPREFDIDDFFRRTIDQAHDSTVQQTSEPKHQSTEPVPTELVKRETVDVSAKLENGNTHVANHLETKNTAKRVEVLEPPVESAGKSSGHHIHGQFDHQLGNLRSSQLDNDTNVHDNPTSDRDETVPVANLLQQKQIVQALTNEDVTSLLQNTQNLQTAIILNEILKPASSRWQM